LFPVTGALRAACESGWVTATLDNAIKAGAFRAGITRAGNHSVVRAVAARHSRLRPRNPNA